MFCVGSHKSGAPPIAELPSESSRSHPQVESEQGSVRSRTTSLHSSVLPPSNHLVAPSVFRFKPSEGRKLAPGEGRKKPPPPSGKPKPQKPRVLSEQGSEPSEATPESEVGPSDHEDTDYDQKLADPSQSSNTEPWIDFDPSTPSAPPPDEWADLDAFIMEKTPFVAANETASTVGETPRTPRDLLPNPVVFPEPELDPPDTTPLSNTEAPPPRPVNFRFQTQLPPEERASHATGRTTHNPYAHVPVHTPVHCGPTNVLDLYWTSDYVNSPHWSEIWNVFHNQGPQFLDGDFSIRYGKLYDGQKLCVPECHALEMVRTHHFVNGHPGIDRLVKSFILRYEVPPLSEGQTVKHLAERIKRGCAICQVCEPPNWKAKG